MYDDLIKNSARRLIVLNKKLKEGEVLSQTDHEEVKLTLNDLKTASAERVAAIDREKQTRHDLEQEKVGIVKQIGEEGLVKVSEYRKKLKEGIVQAKNSWWAHLKNGDFVQLDKDHLWINNAEQDLNNYNQLINHYRQITAQIEALDESIEGHKAKKIEYEELIALYEEL